MIPFPYLYQPWKHHLLFLRERIQLALERGEKFAEVPEGLRKMGDSVTDLYIGSWSVEAVRSWMASRIPEEALSDPDPFREWIGDEGYRMVELPDSSTWVLKATGRDDRWIHFHPGRASPLTLRVRGRTLKTAFMVCLDSARYGRDPLDKRLVDRVRATHWGLQPLRTLHSGKGLGRVLALLCRDRNA